MRSSQSVTLAEPCRRSMVARLWTMEYTEGQTDNRSRGGSYLSRSENARTNDLKYAIIASAQNNPTTENSCGLYQ